MVIKMVLKVLAAEQCQQTTLQEVEQLHAKFLMVPLLSSAVSPLLYNPNQHGTSQICTNALGECQDG